MNTVTTAYYQGSFCGFKDALAGKVRENLGAGVTSDYRDGYSDGYGAGYMAAGQLQFTDRAGLAERAEKAKRLAILEMVWDRR